jgi:hypothetical protein
LASDISAFVHLGHRNIVTISSSSSSHTSAAAAAATRQQQQQQPHVSSSSSHTSAAAAATRNMATAIKLSIIESAHNIRMPLALILRLHAPVIRPNNATHFVAAAAQSMSR